MKISFAAKHAKGKAANDIIFLANGEAVKAAQKSGADKVVNATIGAILDEEEKLVCLPTVENVYRNMDIVNSIAYAPISGLKEFKTAVIEAAFGNSKPEGYMDVVATAGGTGAIHHAIWNYMDEDETLLTSDWYWGPYSVLCKDMGRKLDTYKMLDENNKFNLKALKEKVEELLLKQDNLLLLINTPAHNPTGYSLSEKDIDGVFEILKTVIADSGKTVTLLLDIAYIDYAGEKEEVRKFFNKLSNLPEQILTIVAYSMSKSFTFYGQRTGAMIGLSSNEDVIKEFAEINQYTSRATWSNINRPAMKTLATVYENTDVLDKVVKEREYYYQMIKARADLFSEEAKECGLKMLPYVAGFFISIPAENAIAICNKLKESNIFVVPLAAGVRVAVCAIPLAKTKGIASKIQEAIESLS